MVNLQKQWAGRWTDRYEVQISYYANGTVSGELWFLDGKFHRVGAPAVLHYNESGLLILEAWHVHGDRHRPPEEGPATRQIEAKTGVVSREEYYLNDVPHRLDGPALVARNPKTGVVYREEYFLNGVRHRTDGPALVIRNAKTGEVRREQFAVHGRVQRRRRMPAPT